MALKTAKKKNTLLQVLPTLESGGVERGTVDIAAAAAKAGYRSLVVSAGGKMVRELERVGATHITRPVQSKNPFVMWRNADDLTRLIHEEKVDIVHARSRAPAWSCRIAARRTGVPLVTTFHGVYNFNNPLKKAYNSVMTKGDRVIAVSHFVADHITRHYRTDPMAVRTIHRGVDTAIFSPDKVAVERVVQLANRWRLPDGMPVVMLPGRLARWKGHLLLLRALKHMRGGPVRCIFVGDTTGRAAYVAEINSLATRLGLEGWVHIVGNYSDMAAAYMLADAVVSASTDPEAFGRVAVEAQAMGRLVIAPAHGAAPEQIVEGKTGWLFTPGDARELAAKLELALTGTAHEPMRKAAMANVRRNFSNRKMCRATLAVYDELLQAPDLTPEFQQPENVPGHTGRL